jgi:hypothetical protein
MSRFQEPIFEILPLSSVSLSSAFKLTVAEDFSFLFECLRGVTVDVVLVVRDRQVSWRLVRFSLSFPFHFPSLVFFCAQRVNSLPVLPGPGPNRKWPIELDDKSKVVHDDRR